MPETRLLIVQPYIPNYRVAFFDQLVPKLAPNGITCRVVAGDQGNARNPREDGVSAPWAFSTRARHLSAFGKSVGTLGSASARRRADAVIVGMLGSSVDAYGALIQRWSRGMRVGLWGHIDSYVNAGNWIDTQLEHWQARHADHIFAYTPGGARKALSYGVPPTNITTVMNSVDVSATELALGELSAESLLEFQHEHGIDPMNAASFIGGLDRPKRVHFLQEALDIIWAQDRGFKLLVGGRGADEDVLRPSIERGQVIRLGYAGAKQKALMARSSRALAMPGRIGLVAVESLALGLPVVTTNWAFHAPESEYLNEGTTRFSSAGNDPLSYAQQLLATVQRSKMIRVPRNQFPSIGQMVDNFSEGVVKMLS